MKIFTVLKKRALLVALIAFLAANVVQAQTYPVYVTDQTPTTPLVNPTSSSFQPRYISGFGMDDAFKVFFEDRDNSNTISFNSTTTGPEGFSAGNTETNIAPETHFCVKDWPININGTDYDYRAWGSVGNNANHRFYVSNDLLNWTLVSTFTISNATSFTNSRGWVYYGFHDVILINGTYYAFAESNQSQTMICKSTQADDNWEAIAAVGGTQAGDGPLQLPAGVTYGWTPSGNFFNLGDDVGYGKVYCDPRDSDFYLAINTEAKSSLEPAQFEAAFINPANWNWHDGTTGAANAPILSETSEHDLRECWLVPNSESFDEWNIIYDADYGSSDGGKALGYATLAPITEVWVDDDFDNTDPGWQVVRFDNITDAIDAVSEGTTITVLDGTYNENLLIDKNLTLVSENGKDVTTIEGVSGVGSLGTIQITNATDGLQIGAENQGFTIIGIDNGNPGLENAAVYFQGNGHTNATIQYNEIQANGDAALMAEYNRDITYFDINNNTFSGKTFVGPNPAGDGFSQQFTLPNVPRQLVVFGGGGGGTNTYHINFTDNQVTGIAGGYNTSGNEQGNTLVTIDADNSVITGNTFNGTTTRYGASLRSRRLNTTISGNTFSSANLTPTCSQLYVQNKALDAALIVANTFDKGVYVEDPNGGSVGLLIQGYIDGASIGDVINLLAGTYNEDLQFDKSVNLHGAGPDATILTNRMRLGGNLEDITLKDFRIERDEAPLMSAEYLNPVFDGVTFDNVKFILNGESTNPNVGGRRALTFGFGFPTAVEGDGLLFQDVTMQATDPDEVAAFMILQSSGGGPVTFDNITIIGSGSYNSINTFGNTDVITVTNSNAENGGSFYLSGLNEISVTNNTFSGDGGVFVNGVNSAEISDNFFENKSINGYPAISFSAAWGPTQNYSVNFVNNIFNNIDNKGIRIYNYTAEDPDNDFLTATNNDFSGVSGLVIDNQYPEHTLVTATCNWWGTTDPQTIGGLISEGVQASPFLVSDDLDNPDCSGVGPVENITQGLTHFTIQEAINAANANDEIEVNAGTYQENLEIDVEGLTLTAVGDVTIQDVDDPEDPLWPTPNGEPSGHRVPVIHIGANNVTIDGFKVRDFDIVTYVFPVLWVNADGVTVQNMDFYTDEAYPGWQQPNEIRIEGNNATIQGNTILRDHDYQNGHPAITLGVAPQYPLASNSQVGDVVIENNSITGGPIGGDVLDNATVELINNTIDGAWQEGIWFYPVAATADLIITGNTVQNHDKAALGSKGLKVVSKPATINAQTHTNDMLDALIADNPNVPSFLLQWVKDVHNVTQDLFYDNIQPAIDAANASDVIEVAAGTYNEQVTIDKALTLNGAQADVDPVSGGRSGGESTIQCDYDISPHAMIILADNVTVNGFEFIETYTSIDVRTDVDVTRQNVSLKYHYINSDAAWVGVGVGQDLDAGPKSTGEGFFDNIEVNNTLFEVSAVNNTHNDYVNAAINLTSGFTDFVTYSNLIITDNDVANEGSYGIFAGGNPNDFLVDGVTISDNHIHDCSTGINVYNLKDLTFDGNIIEDITYTGAQINIRTGSVTNNTFQNIGPSPYWPYNGDYYPSTGLKLWGDQYGPVGSHDATITNNTFNYNNFDPEEEYAARVLDGCDASTISFNSNAFINGNAVADILAIKNYVAGQTLEATCNWWDTTDPYEIDELTEGDILFLPFWTSETGPCDGIGPVVNTTQDISYMTIQAAIDAADHGDDIEVAAGTYNEDLQINKPLELYGAGASQTTIVVSNKIVASGINGSLTFEGFEVEKPGEKSYTGTSFSLIGYGIDNEQITITNNIFTKGRLYLDHLEQNVLISNNTFNNASIGWDRHLGEIEIANNTINVYDNGIGIFTWAWYIEGQQDTDNFDELHSIHDNTINTNNGCGILYYSVRDRVLGGEWNSTPNKAKFTNLQIENNTITNVGDGYENAGIALMRIVGQDSEGEWSFEGLTDNTGFENATISGNIISGYTGNSADGILLFGSEDTDITDNSISGLNNGFNLNGILTGSSGTTITDNFITGNTVGLQNNSTESVEATENYWGDPSGPYHASNPCGSGDEVSDNVTFSPWYEDAAMTTLGEIPTFTIEGTLVYADEAGTPLPGVTVELKDNGGTLLDSEVTSANGDFKFEGYTNGAYDLEFSTTEAWGGVNFTDVGKMYQEVYNYGTPIPAGLLRTAADVVDPQTPPVIDDSDANAVLYAVWFNDPNTYFEVDEWLFSEATGITIACDNATVALKQGVCAGDVNASKYSSSFAMRLKNGLSPYLSLMHEGVAPAMEGHKASIPVRAGMDLDMSALTMMLNYPAGKFEVSDVRLASPEKGGELYYNTHEGTLNVGIVSLEALGFEYGETMLWVDVELQDNYLPGEGIRFTLAESPLNEIADGYARPIKNGRLTMPVVDDAKQAASPLSLYPNPASEQLHVDFNMVQESQCRMELHSITGERLDVLFEGHTSEGMHSLTYDVSKLNSGVYLLKMVKGNETIITRKLIINHN